MKYRVTREIRLRGEQHFPGSEVEADETDRNVKVFVKLGRLEPASDSSDGPTPKPEPQPIPLPAHATSTVTEIVEAVGTATGRHEARAEGATIVEATGRAEGLSDPGQIYERRDMRAKRIKKPE